VNVAIPIDEVAHALHNAQATRSPIEPLTNRWPTVTTEDAYRVQQRFIDILLAEGRRVIGRKIGVTSGAVMSMLGVNQPDFGALLDDMVVDFGGEIGIETLIQPRAEGEIAFVLKRDLSGPGLTSADVLAATEGVMACFEIVDSRIKDWKIKIQDTVADNASCGVIVLGRQLVPLSGLDLYSCGMVLERNGRIVGLGAGAASMGSPVNAVVWLANTLGRLGVALKAGDLILSGALSGMVPCSRGDHFSLSIGGIGGCAVHFT
jgi:2-oxopent-4-enoate/cis-2-oxohex-4-enoate hydratase